MDTKVDSQDDHRRIVAPSFASGYPSGRPVDKAKLKTVSDNLQEAALALRRLMPRQQQSPTLPQNRHKDSVHRVGASPRTTKGRPELTSAPSGSLHFSLSPADSPMAKKSHGESDFDPGLIARLFQENKALREAFKDASERITRLEEDKHRLFDESVYDLVNSLSGVQRQSNLRQLNSPSTRGETAWSAQSSPAISSALDSARRSKEEMRASELSCENEVLRRELANASEVGDRKSVV